MVSLANPFVLSLQNRSKPGWEKRFIDLFKVCFCESQVCVPEWRCRWHAGGGARLSRFYLASFVRTGLSLSPLCICAPTSTATPPRSIDTMWCVLHSRITVNYTCCSSCPLPDTAQPNAVTNAPPWMINGCKRSPNTPLFLKERRQSISTIMKSCDLKVKQPFYAIFRDLFNSFN